MDENVLQMYGAIQAAHDANNAWSAEQAQKQMDFQERMSNTAHQREVADLKAAGLNPVLSAGGSGATTGSGAMANRSDENVSALYGLINKAFDAQIEASKAAMHSGAQAASVSGDIPDLLEDAVADWVKRKTGISQDTTKALLKKAGSAFDTLVDDNLLDKAKDVYEFFIDPNAAKELSSDLRTKAYQWLDNSVFGKTVIELMGNLGHNSEMKKDFQGKIQEAYNKALEKTGKKAKK